MKSNILKIALLALMFGAACFPLAAQDRNDEVVKYIREAYNQAREKIKMTTGDESVPRNDVTATLHYMVPATGERTEVFHAWFDLETDEEGAHYLPYFITRKYNVAARNYYEEYLFEPETGLLLFVLIQSDNFEGGKDEQRYYFGAMGELVHQIIKGGDPFDADSLLLSAARIRGLIPQYLDFSY